MKLILIILLNNDRNEYIKYRWKKDKSACNPLLSIKYMELRILDLENICSSRECLYFNESRRYILLPKLRMACAGDIIVIIVRHFYFKMRAG
jgi:hypothetical protein